MNWTMPLSEHHLYAAWLHLCNYTVLLLGFIYMPLSSPCKSSNIYNTQIWLKIHPKVHHEVNFVHFVLCTSWWSASVWHITYQPLFFDLFSFFFSCMAFFNSIYFGTDLLISTTIQPSLYLHWKQVFWTLLISRN